MVPAQGARTGAATRAGSHRSATRRARTTGPFSTGENLTTAQANYNGKQPYGSFPAGEFRHGSSAMLDATTAIIGIVDESSRDIVHRPLAEAVEAEAARYVIGAHSGDVPLLGPATGEAFNTLAWLVAGQYLALSIGRANFVESDAPRGLRKWVG